MVASFKQEPEQKETLQQVPTALQTILLLGPNDPPDSVILEVFLMN